MDKILISQPKIIHNIYTVEKQINKFSKNSLFTPESIEINPYSMIYPISYSEIWVFEILLTSL